MYDKAHSELLITLPTNCPTNSRLRNVIAMSQLSRVSPKKRRSSPRKTSSPNKSVFPKMDKPSQHFTPAETTKSKASDILPDITAEEPYVFEITIAVKPPNFLTPPKKSSAQPISELPTLPPIQLSTIRTASASTATLTTVWKDWLQTKLNIIINSAGAAGYHDRMVRGIETENVVIKQLLF